MNKYKKQIIIKLFGIFFIIFSFGIISGMFLFIPFLISFTSLILLIKTNNIKHIDKEEVNNLNKTDNYIRNNNNNNQIIRHYGKNKVKIKKRIKY